MVLGFRWGVKGVSRGGSFYTASHTAFMERCGYRLNNSKVQVGGMLGFPANGVYRGSAYTTLSSMTRDAYRRGGQASLIYAQGYIGFRWGCEWCNEGMRF